MIAKVRNGSDQVSSQAEMRIPYNFFLFWGVEQRHILFNNIKKGHPMNISKRIATCALGIVIACAGVVGTTAPAMAAVGNGSYARAARNLTWADAYNTAGSRGYARAEVGRIINGKRVVYYNGWKHGYAYTSATTGSSWYARGLLK